MYAELLSRSCFSFLRGGSHPEELIERADELKLHTLALTDLDGIYGAVRAYRRHQELIKAGRAKATHYAVGAELSLEFFDGEGAESARFTLGLLVQNHEGYANLCRLLTKGHENRPKGECALSLSALEENASGLFALWVAPERPTRDSLAEKARREALGKVLATAFPERAAILTYRYRDGWDRLRERWVKKRTEEYELPVVASARPHYHQSARKPLYDVLTAIRMGMTLDEAGSLLEPNAERFLRSEDEMRALFHDHLDWVDESGVVAGTLKFSFSELRYHFPCQLEEGQTADERLSLLTWEGVKRRFPGGISEKLHDQIEKELALIAKIDVAAYFLSTRDIVEIAREKSILCQGRGSAANSAVCYALGITAVDPSRSNLLFERFLSEERAEPPDIDVDFEHERREEVIQEIYARYGRDRAAMVSEIISYRGKSALREVGRVFGLSEEQVSRLSGTASFWRDEEDEEKGLVEAGFDLRDARLRQVIALARELRGFPRHLSIHVGGFVLSSRSLSEVAPVEPARRENRTVIPWDKDDIDTLGFFKVDVLGLGMLSAIRKALALIVESGGLLPEGSAQLDVAAHPVGAEQTEGAQKGVSEGAARDENSPGKAKESAFDPLEVITRIPSKDELTYERICRADTVGVFQIESRAQMAMLPRLRPRTFYDLVIEVALVRPGPIQGGMVHPYLRRRNHEEEVTFPHKKLVSILKRTLGVPLFQEQVMQVAIVGAGYTGGEADQLRRDMAAWKKHGRLLAHRERLMSGFRQNDISSDFAEALFEQIKGFGEYGFPESHASSFALLVYASAWQKTHYPAHFACALLNSQPMGFYPPTTLVRDAQRHGVAVHDVCVFTSAWDSSLEETDGKTVKSRAVGAQKALRLGLRLVTGLGEDSGRRVVEARERLIERGDTFLSVEHFARVTGLGKKEVALLAEAGALEKLAPGRRNALWESKAPVSPGLFAELDSGEEKLALPELRSAEQLVLDYATKGLSVSDHPLRHYRKRLRKLGATRAADLLYLPKGSRVMVAGLVMSRQRPATASGVVFVTLEDETGFVNVIFHSDVYETFHQVATHSPMLLICGEIERDPRIPVLAPEFSEEDAPVKAVIHVLARSAERLTRETFLSAAKKQQVEPAKPSRMPRLSRDFH